MPALKNPVVEADHIQGSLDAPAVLVEYGDFECPHCRMAHAVVHRLQHHFGERLCFVFRNFPLTRIHPFAETAAESAEFAAANGKFWEMHDSLFKHQDQFGSGLFARLATELGLDGAELDAAIESSAYTQRVHTDFVGGVRSGVNGTPTFFLNGERHDGGAEYDLLRDAIEAAIRAAIDGAN